MQAALTPGLLQANLTRMSAVLTFLLAAAAVGAAEPAVSVVSRENAPGEVLLVAVTGHHDAAAPSGSLGGRELSFFRASSGTFLALAGLDVAASTGALALRIDGVESVVLVSSKAFPLQALAVAPRYVEPPKKDAERAEREAERLKELFARRTAETLFQGNFVSPVPGATASRFGERRVFNGVPKDPHGGADLKAKKGTRVRAPAGGTVVLADSLFYQGKTVILDHGRGLYSGYYHLSRISVKEGQKVRRGGVLGRVGATGRATGPHLHWSVRLDGARVDPFSLTALDLDGWLARH